MSAREALVRARAKIAALEAEIAEVHRYVDDQAPDKVPRKEGFNVVGRVHRLLERWRPVVAVAERFVRNDGVDTLDIADAVHTLWGNPDWRNKLAAADIDAAAKLCTCGVATGGVLYHGGHYPPCPAFVEPTERAEVKICTCGVSTGRQQATAFSGNPFGHYVGCPKWGNDFTSKPLIDQEPACTCRAELAKASPTTPKKHGHLVGCPQVTKEDDEEDIVLTESLQIAKGLGVNMDEDYHLPMAAFEMHNRALVAEAEVLKLTELYEEKERDAAMDEQTLETLILLLKGKVSARELSLEKRDAAADRTWRDHQLHPMQHVFEGEGSLTRFRRNQLVHDLFEGAASAISMEDDKYSIADKLQLVQLLGYTCAGLEHLSWLPNRLFFEVERCVALITEAEEE